MYRRLPPLTGVPNSKLVRFRFMHEGILDAPATGNAYAAYKANSIFQPIGGATGDHAPMGSDQWQVFYNHCTVLGSKALCRFYNAGITNLIPGYVGCILADTDTVLSGLATTTVLEQKWRSKISLAGIVNNSAGGGATGMFTAVRKFSARKFFGTRFIRGVTPYRGSFVADPDERAFFIIYQLSSGATNAGAITYIIQIEYICLLAEPKTLPQSAT